VVEGGPSNQFNPSCVLCVFTGREDRPGQWRDRRNWGTFWDTDENINPVGG